jgi:hypothetical protein
MAASVQNLMAAPSTDSQRPPVRRFIVRRFAFDRRFIARRLFLDRRFIARRLLFLTAAFVS